ncbi:glucosaminidase domain-containing protein [Lacticaseibacillus paracasei]|uniref:glucosaminidase domain-containing protein n=1 Tax=Lacticaseibacillus paracasei TaxID=1597 RepID=UPI000FED8D00|nr:glucosaminidase domain-containing protein [Lacticaseibacillus paracasei]RND41228.1 Mannosyl-glycoprotein endo-beta-N-acetylglucosaminidase [Lacticaseibacillus paracasei]
MDVAKLATGYEGKKLKYFAYLIGGFLIFMVLMIAGVTGGLKEQEDQSTNADIDFTSDIKIFPEIKGRGPFSDSIAQLAVGTAAKYKLLPSVILSQYAYESANGTSLSAKTDNNFFGITYFDGAPFPAGTARGIGGSEGGRYMKFPNATQSFNYYGSMLAKQANFKAVVGKKDPGEVLLILGRGGYAAAGIDESSPYYSGAMNIIKGNKLSEYDDFAIKHWGETGTPKSSGDSGAALEVLEQKLGQTLNNGECYGLTAYYVQKMGGPQLMGSGHSSAQYIGTDYDWSKYGWTVIMHPKPGDIKKGDIVNWQAGGVLSPGPWGHTGVVRGVQDGGQTLETYEQNAGKGRVAAKYVRSFDTTPIMSLVRKG